MKIRHLILLCVLLLVALCATGATVSYNTNAAGNHGYYNGTGGVDGGFTTVAEVDLLGNGIAGSLRLAQRFVGPIIPIGNDYVCATMMQCNVDWSLNGVGNTNLSDYTYTLFLQDLTNGGASLTFDPTNPILGGSYWDPVLGKVMAWNPSVVGNENSQYLGFSFISIPLGGWHSTDTVYASLTITNKTTGLSTSVDMWVNRPEANVPEPGTVILTGAALALICFGRSKIRS